MKQYIRNAVRKHVLAAGGFLALAVVVAIFAAETRAQSTSGTPPTSSQQQQSQQQGQQTQQDQKKQPPAESGGPGGDVGPIALPKKKDESEAPPPPKPLPQQTPSFNISVNAPLVTLDVSVFSKDGHFIPGLKKDMFKVYEDGVPQTLTQFTQSADAPITAVLLIEFANNQYFYSFMIDSLRASYTFAEQLKKDDWIAAVAYDLKPTMLTDFTQDKRAVMGSLGALRPQTAGFSETNLFDALYDTLDRLDSVEGRKYIILVSSGRDTFSKMTLDKTLKKVQAAKDTVIYAVSTGQALRLYAESHGMMSYLCNMTDFSCSSTYLQADNQLNTFTRMTGGKAYFPRFEGEFPEDFADIALQIRNEYVLAYHPTNAKLDGTYRKLQVKLVDQDGKTPLKMRDPKGKDVKYQIVAREGYTAKHTVD